MKGLKFKSIGKEMKNQRKKRKKSPFRNKLLTMGKTLALTAGISLLIGLNASCSRWRPTYKPKPIKAENEIVEYEIKTEKVKIRYIRAEELAFNKESKTFLKRFNYFAGSLLHYFGYTFFHTEDKERFFWKNPEPNKEIYSYQYFSFYIPSPNYPTEYIGSEYEIKNFIGDINVLKVYIPGNFITKIMVGYDKPLFNMMRTADKIVDMYSQVYFTLIKLNGKTPLDNSEPKGVLKNIFSRDTYEELNSSKYVLKVLYFDEHLSGYFLVSEFFSKLVSVDEFANAYKEVTNKDLKYAKFILLPKDTKIFHSDLDVSSFDDRVNVGILPVEDSMDLKAGVLVTRKFLKKYEKMPILLVAFFPDVFLSKGFFGYQGPVIIKKLISLDRNNVITNWEFKKEEKKETKELKTPENKEETKKE